VETERTQIDSTKSFTGAFQAHSSVKLALSPETWPRAVQRGKKKTKQNRYCPF